MMKQKIKSLVFPILLVFYEISCYLSNDMYLPAVPDLLKDLQLTTQQVQFTLTTWFLGLATMPLFLGVLSDQYGRRLILLSGGVVYILATVVCAMTTHYWVFLAARFIEGGMASSMMVAGYATIHELYDHKAAIRILALMGSISVLAPALGPLCGGIVLFFTSWRAIFWLIAIWASISVLLLMKWMPETLSIEQKNKLNIRQLLQTYGSILSNPHFMFLMAILGCLFAGFISWVTAGPLLVIQHFHYSPTVFGFLQAGIFAAYIIGTSLVNKLVDKINAKRLIQIGMSIVFLSCCLMAMLTLLLPTTLYGFVSAMVIYSFGTGLCFAPLNRTIIESSHVAMGSRVALFTIFLTIFAAIGSAMAGMYFDGSILSLAYLIIGFTIISFIIKTGLRVRGIF